MKDFLGNETNIVDMVVFNVPNYKALGSSKALKFTPKGIKVNYVCCGTGSIKETFMEEGQFVIVNDIEHGSRGV